MIECEQGFIQVKVHQTPRKALQNVFKLKKTRNQLEDYELKQTIGEGGFGKVKRAIHKPTGQTVAIKIISTAKLNKEKLQDIQKEISLQQKLMHEHIAQIYDVIRKDGKYYIIIEYCQKGELFQKIIRDGPMHEKDAAKYLNQILSALLYLKKLGLAHRDIKPQNILFDKNFNIKLVDFGFCCNSSNNTDMQDAFRTTVCGTPSYTPPQVLLKKPYSAELMDVWSLGVTLYAMIAAQLPFQGQTIDQRKAKIINYRWQSKSFFSQKVQKLLNTIFTQSSKRITLSQILKSDFLNQYKFVQAEYIDYTTQKLIVQQSIITELEVIYKFQKRIIIDSISNYKLDRYRVHYYLALNKQIKNKNSLRSQELNKYKKQRRSSLTKLEPIHRMINSSLDNHKDNIETPRLFDKGYRIRRGSVNIQIEKNSQKHVQIGKKCHTNHFPYQTLQFYGVMNVGLD